MRILESVLQRLQQHGVNVRKEKCKFLSPSVEFLCYRIDEMGRHPLQNKVQAIHNAPVPKNVSETKIISWSAQLLWVIYVTGFGKTCLIAGLVKLDFFFLKRHLLSSSTAYAKYECFT